MLTRVSVEAAMAGVVKLAANRCQSVACFMFILLFDKFIENSFTIYVGHLRHSIERIRSGNHFSQYSYIWRCSINKVRNLMNVKIQCVEAIVCV